MMENMQKSVRDIQGSIKCSSEKYDWRLGRERQQTVIVFEQPLVENIPILSKGIRPQSPQGLQTQLG